MGIHSWSVIDTNSLPGRYYIKQFYQVKGYKRLVPVCVKGVDKTSNNRNENRGDKDEAKEDQYWYNKYNPKSLRNEGNYGWKWRQYIL
jgi:hypothetical protein